MTTNKIKEMKKIIDLARITKECIGIEENRIYNTRKIIDLMAEEMKKQQILLQSLFRELDEIEKKEWLKSYGVDTFESEVDQ